jgi:small ligand-binding sensory domain FIST
LTLSRSLPVQFAWSGRDLVKDDEATTIGVYQGGLSGVAFGEQISIVNRVSQGCRPIGPTRTITACDDHIILEIDHHPALEILLQDLEIDLQKPQAAMLKLRSTLVGVTQPQSAIVNKSGEFGESAWIRHIIGIDPSRKAVAITDQVKVGEKMAFCQRNQAIARADLLRIGAEIRETLDPFLALNSDLILTAAGAFPVQPTQKEPQIAGAIYISCSGRGGAYFGGPSAELQLVARALGDVPLVGFFAAGEIAHQNIHAYTGILTVFTNH